MLTGKWTYRSYLNRTSLVGGDAAAALELIFGEGVFDLTERDGQVRGALGMGTGYALTIEGHSDGTAFALAGTGLPGTATEGWDYRYRGVVTPHWPEAIDQIPCLVGTALRAKPHGPSAPAGVTVCFIAVRHDDSPPPRTERTFALLA